MDELKPILIGAWFDAMFRCKRCGAEFIAPRKHGKLSDAVGIQEKLTRHIREEHPEPIHVHIKEVDDATQ